MQQVQQINPLTRQHSSLAPLRVFTIQPSRWEQVSTWMKEAGTTETVTEILLATSTFSLVSGLLLAVYRALEHYTIILLP